MDGLPLREFIVSIDCVSGEENILRFQIFVDEPFGFQCLNGCSQLTSEYTYSLLS